MPALPPPAMTEAVTYDFSQLFDADEYLYFMEDTLRAENTSAQVDFIERTLGLAAGQRVLDLGCGHGRHAIEFARRGYRVTGIDLSESFIGRARTDALTAGVDARFVHGDIGAFEVQGGFDAAVCLFDAFGFFDDAHCLRALQNTCAALLPGGALLLDLRTREWMLRQPPVTVVDKGNGDLMIDRQHFDVLTGRLVDRRTMLRGPTRRDLAFSVRLFAFTEIRSLLAMAGLDVTATYGGFDGAPMLSERPRMLIVARRPPA